MEYAPGNYPDIMVGWYKFAPYEVKDLPYTGPAMSIASFLISGSRRNVINNDTGQTFQHGTWHLPNPERLYTSIYEAGNHTIEVGGEGLEYLCLLKPDYKPPLVTWIEVAGVFRVPAGSSVVVACGQMTAIEGLLIDEVKQGHKQIGYFGAQLKGYDILCAPDEGKIKADILLIRPL